MNNTADNTLAASSSAPKATITEKTNSARSAVRRWVTYIATAFVFGGGTVMIIGFVIFGGETGIAAAKDLFTAILPIGTGIITFWFAGRSHEKAREQNSP